MTDLTQPYDVLVIGGGNAALCAAITAREAGATVLLLEAAPRAFRGGNSRHTRNLRCMHDAPLHMLTEAYPEEEYFQDVLKVTGGETNEALARQTIRGSLECLPWMVEHGVRFQPSLGGTLHLSRTNSFFLGGGKALINAYFHAAAENIQIHGGIGFTWEHPAHLYFKRAKSSELLFGDPSYHRELLAQRIGI
jgi:tricarballylate dehydrogenase